MLLMCLKNDINLRLSALLNHEGDKIYSNKNCKPLKWEMRSIINAMFYIVKSGCQWRMLPHQMPPWQNGLFPLQKVENDLIIRFT